MGAEVLKIKYLAFLRGINVGGHHKVPMAELRRELENLGFTNVVTILNSGNVIFDSAVNESKNIENVITEHLENYFGFPIPVIVRKAETILGMIHRNSFKKIDISKDSRRYITFLKTEIGVDIDLPWTSPDKSFQILENKAMNVLSILDLSISKTPKAMEVLESFFGKELTTRNWNTLEELEKRIQASR